MLSLEDIVEGSRVTHKNTGLRYTVVDAGDDEVLLSPESEGMQDLSVDMKLFREEFVLTDRFSVGRRELVFFDTQGHARHHFCIYDETSRGVFTGDTFGIAYAPMKTLGRGLLPTTPPSQFDPAALHASVERIMQFAPERLYLTHYGEYADPARQVESFHAWIDRYVDLCRQQAGDDDFSERLESALGEEIFAALPDNREPALAQILANDLRLNAQGLEHWWRNTRHE